MVEDGFDIVDAHDDIVYDVVDVVDGLLLDQQPGSGARWWICYWHLPDKQVEKYI